MRGSRTANTRAERAGFPAALFGKTPVKKGFPESEFAPAEFFFLLFYILHNDELLLENVIPTLSQSPLFAHSGPCSSISPLCAKSGPCLHPAN